jgi:hypothetical protein
MDGYTAFLAEKGRVAAPVGFNADPARLPGEMKPFQADLTSWACRRGRAALFEGTGLGKTVQELAWAQEVQHETRKPVLVLTPLAVAEQTVLEAQKFNIDGVAYASDHDAARTPIVVTNYDRRHLFDFSKFGGVVLDESSILKADDSATRADLLERCADVPYLLPASATPAPNDWTELGHHAELLGVMRAKEMLAMFFVHDGSNRANGGDGWRLKRHAEQDFWRWLASWAVMVRKPADLGYDEPGYDLPPLRKHQITVPSGADLGFNLFHTDVSGLAERIAERRSSLPQRVGATAEIVGAQRDRPWLLWCQLNDEGDQLTKSIPGAVQVAGSDSREVKTARLLAFSRGEIEVLVSKPSICGHGMNWQHCSDMAFVGLNDSFEQLYQAIRRCWRFGQSRPVNAHFVASEREGPVVKNLNRKEQDFEAMSEAMAVHMRDITRSVVRGGRVAVSAQHANRTMELPTWLAA